MPVETSFRRFGRNVGSSTGSHLRAAWSQLTRNVDPFIEKSCSVQALCSPCIHILRLDSRNVRWNDDFVNRKVTTVTPSRMCRNSKPALRLGTLSHTPGRRWRFCNLPNCSYSLHPVVLFLNHFLGYFASWWFRLCCKEPLKVVPFILTFERSCDSLGRHHWPLKWQRSYYGTPAIRLRDTPNAPTKWQFVSLRSHRWWFLGCQRFLSALLCKTLQLVILFTADCVLLWTFG